MHFASFRAVVLVGLFAGIAVATGCSSSGGAADDDSKKSSKKDTGDDDDDDDVSDDDDDSSKPKEKTPCEKPKLADVAEVEPNDFDHAQALELGSSVHGLLETGTPYDYYSLHLDEPTKVRVTLASDGTDVLPFLELKGAEGVAATPITLRGSPGTLVVGTEDFPAGDYVLYVTKGLSGGSVAVPFDYVFTLEDVAAATDDCDGT